MPRRNNPRSWDSRVDPLTPSTDSSVPSSESQTAGNPESNCLPDRVVHDASIFIGCLPSGVDHAALATSLSEHLSQYSGIQGIRVVHDSKGGTCAFIQCQDHFTATTLLQTLRASTPRQFMGRYLRYEPARAFRTLLISYRTPWQYKGTAHPDETLKGMPHQSNSVELVELALPTAMKLVKTPGARWNLTVLYNSNALTDHGNGGTSLLLDPLLYDADTLMKVTALFGPVDHFRPYKPVEDTSPCTEYPNLHDGPRSALMDRGCWEVKWRHRDDCMSAWTTLRKVPHLTVTWAHQSHSETHGQQQPSISCASSFDHTSQGWGSHIITRDDLDSPECTRFTPSFPHPAMNRDSLAHQVDLMPTLWVRNAPTTPDTRMRRCRNRAASLTQTKSLPPLQFSEKISMPWDLALKSQCHGPLQGQQVGLGTSKQRIMRSATFTTLLSTHLSLSDSGATRDVDQEEVPSPPKFAAFPTPRGAVGRRSPTPGNDVSIVSSSELSRQVMQSPPEEGNNVVCDSTTIFVGGLQMSGPKAWVEGRVHALFSKYRGVKCITVVRPANNRPGYAFVKFDNTESPLQAISGEHNRIVDGRRIRVQLRDLRPYRRQFIFGQEVRGLEPSTNSGEGSQDDLTHGNNVSTEHVIPLDAAIRNGPSSHKVNSKHHADRAALEAQGGHRALTSESVSTPDSQQGPNDNTPAGTVDASLTSAPLMPSPSVTAYPVPAIAYYHPQGWMPGFGPYPYPHYLGYQVAPQLIPPFHQGTSVEGSQSTPGAVPLSGFESGPAPYIPYPHVVGYTLPDGGRPGTAASPLNYHVPAPLTPTGFSPGNPCPPFPTTGVLIGETPENEGSSAVTWRPYPHMQPPPVFFQPFPQPLPYPGNPLGPNSWFPNYSWNEEMLHPSASQDLSRSLLPPSIHEVNVEPKLRNHLPRRLYRRDGSSRVSQEQPVPCSGWPPASAFSLV
ncbi:hypothetical protein EDC04DRAFT_2886763 [Pisolithus marmoratus]|nr:hypothetical protein EDC04DRAFT_2886763 [Pisolithus marmoratus]